MSTNCFK